VSKDGSTLCRRYGVVPLWCDPTIVRAWVHNRTTAVAQNPRPFWCVAVHDATKMLSREHTDSKRKHKLKHKRKCKTEGRPKTQRTQWPQTVPIGSNVLTVAPVAALLLADRWVTLSIVEREKQRERDNVQTHRSEVFWIGTESHRVRSCCLSSQRVGTWGPASLWQGSTTRCTTEHSDTPSSAREKRSGVVDQPETNPSLVLMRWSRQKRSPSCARRRQGCCWSRVP
jgi:hypothetical protein